MKVAVVGGGGFRTPLLVAALARVSSIEHVALHDPDGDRLERIAAVIRARHRERPLPFDLERGTDLEPTVESAGAVLTAIRPGGNEARVVDEAVPISLGVLGQETVGPGGIAFALRSVPAMRAIASVVERRAPRSWLVNFTNPAGIVTEAVRDLIGDRVVGICDSPAALCARVAAALERPASSLVFDYAGLNHLGWLVGVEDDGRDVLPNLLEDHPSSGRIEEVGAFGLDRVRELGAIPNEYLLYLERADRIVRTVRTRGRSRGEEVASQQRDFFEMPRETGTELDVAWRRALDRRNVSYMTEARPSPVEPPGAGPTAAGATAAGATVGPGEEGYASVAVDFLRAVTTDEPGRLILNTSSGGRLTGIGDDEVIEATCGIDRGRIEPIGGRALPAEAQRLAERVKEVERLTIRAATTGSAALAFEAIAAHPLVPSRDVAERILAGYLERQPALREALA